MKKNIFILVIFCMITALAGCGKSSNQKKPLVIEILFMNHGPVQPVLRDLRQLFTHFGKKIKLSWHDFEEDEDFKAKKGVNTHVPIVIWLNNQKEVMIGNKKIHFFGFPANRGPRFARGNWTIQDLKRAIKNKIKEKKL